MRTLLVDNHDSFTYNLFQLMAQGYGVEPIVISNDSPELETIDPDAIDAIVISPGPGNPELAADVGRTAELLHRADLPVLGVCFGHQLLGMLAGARVRPAPAPVHGRIDRIRHAGGALFAGIEPEFSAVRYHSLCLQDPLPDEIEPLAWAQDGVLMAMRHRSRPWHGVQFHPESVGTDFGAVLLGNFARLAGAARRPSTARPPRPGRTPPAPAAPSPAPASAPVSAGGAVAIVARELDGPVDTETAFVRLFGELDYAFWLDSNRRTGRLGRYSFLGAPGPSHGEVLRYRIGSGAVRVRRAGGWRTEATTDIFATLRARLAHRSSTTHDELPFPLRSGYVGYLGYEIRDDCGSPVTATSPLPDAVWMTADRMVVVDHEAGRSWLVASVDPEESGAAERWLDHAAGVLAGPADNCAGDDPPRPWNGDLSGWATRSEAAYLQAIEECRRQLRLGNSYEICLTNSFDLPFTGEALGFYRRLRVLNPAPYSAFVRFDDFSLASSSPERFLTIDGDGVAESRPIKGTAARDPDLATDARTRDELAHDPKTVAENLMIADLLRHDLGSVSEIGSVTVPALMHVESYATLHQLVTTVRSRPKPGVSAVDVTRACFPGGSMTGAPKERTMTIIDRLEQRPRGPYSGSLGYFSDSGECDLSIVIRTAVVHAGRLTLGAGGAIVLDSDGRAEHAEMLLKAQACLQAYCG